MVYSSEQNLKWVPLIFLHRKPFFGVFLILALLLIPAASKGQESRSYELLWSKSSLLARHVIYQGYFRKIPVFNDEIRCHEQAHVVTCDTTTFAAPDATILLNDFQIEKEEKGWWDTEVGIDSATRYLAKDQDGKSHVFVFAKEKLVYHYEDFSYYQDTLIQVKVFHPNPIVTSGASYGGFYRDNEDMTNFFLEQEKVIRTCIAGFDSGQFVLKNKWIEITDIGLPNDPPVQQAFSQFFFARSDSRFEAVNAFYHLTNFCRRVEIDLGFIDLFSSVILVDPHALNGADNSFYNGNGIHPQINFGQGGVDDAEDAQVVIHELGHAIADFAAPNSNVGTERQALEEGLGDYLGVSYSEMISGRNLQAFASWDGHNEFWPGRWVNTSKKYPDAFQQDIYADGEIWSSALKQIDRVIGSQRTQQALIESLFWYNSGISMREAAQYFLEADSSLNTGIHTDTIRSIFCDRGLLSVCEVTPDYSVPVTVNANYLKEGMLLFSSNVNQFDHLEIFDINAKKVAEFHGPVPRMVDVGDLVQGFYLLQFQKGNEYQVLKVLMY